MSNVVKQYFAVTNSSELCIINSNQRAEERLREQALLYGMQGEAGEENASSDGFTQGLVAENIVLPPEETPEEIIEKAKAQAKQILQEARDKSDQIMNEADRKARLLCEEQRQAGYQAGLDQAAQKIEEIRQEAENEKSQFLAEQKEITEGIREEYERRADELESGIVDAVIQVFDEVFHIQFGDKKEILLHLVKNTLLHVESSKQVRIRVAEGCHHYMEANGEEIRNQLGKDVSVEIVRDMHLSGMECVIETESGVFNCGMDMELSNLLKDIRSLCY